MKTAYPLCTPATILSLVLLGWPAGGCLTRHADPAATVTTDGPAGADTALDAGSAPAVDAWTAPAVDAWTAPADDAGTAPAIDAATAADSGVAPACTTGAAACTDEHTAKVCSATGAWQQQICSGATPLCFEGRCVACSPGAVTCQNGSTLASCDQNHTWQQQTCPSQTPVCDGDACVVCIPGAVACGGGQAHNMVKICNQNRQWQQQFACPIETPRCYQGVCLECEPGTSQACGNCNGGRRTCQANATWGPCQNEPGPIRNWYVDLDGDGWGSTAVYAATCADNYPGFSLKVGDCCDEDARVHPGAGFQSTGDGGCGRGWDFDCSGTVEKQHSTNYANGTCSMASCTLGAIGWASGIVVPECGRSAQLASSCNQLESNVCGQGGCACSVNYTPTVQGCR